MVMQIQDVLWWTLYKAEGVLQGSRLRKAALAESMKLIHYEVAPLVAAMLVVLRCQTELRQVLGTAESVLSHMMMPLPV